MDAMPVTVMDMLCMFSNTRTKTTQRIKCTDYKVCSKSQLYEIRKEKYTE